MNTLERLKAVISFVEKNITEKLDLNHLAEIACCSPYNFQRMFAFVSGMSIVEYIRKRRLTLAGIDLRQNNIKVIDAAMKYGYHSPVSFARAFQAFHGITPSEAKNSNVSDVLLKTFPRMTFQIYIKEFNDVKIVEKDEVILIGCHGENVGDTWGKWESMTDTREIHHGVTDDDGHSAGHEARFYPDGGEHVFVGVEVTQTDPDSAWEYLKIPAGTYAIFDIDQKIDQSPQFHSINEWLDENKNIYRRFVWDADGHISAADFVICMYDHRTAGKYAQSQIMEMWIPIEKITI